ncbi:imm11 family protein [Methylosinus sp. Sm6]|uniref:imm11 family protein n=1 Tax=Methylosinus sp. Sm6 TaxID=2866948 RepID=UPI001C994CA8|nr:DUF1629 domain-containing protein [Methylosinus sp. Sm6]MBY6239728.1 hypothetical protein [Methylosinus sp. Sm6]
MVWGMYLPHSGGSYGPYGDNEGPVDHYGDGWHHRLLKYSQEQMLEAQREFYSRSYPYCVVEKFLYECGHKQPSPDDVVVTPIEQHEPPRFRQTHKGYKELASIITIGNRMWAVDEAIKRLIYRLEPGLHQFYPLEIRMPRGRVYPVQYYVLVVGRWLDSLSPNDSDRRSFAHYNPEINHFFIHGYQKNVTGLALRQSVFKGAHLWRERGLKEWLICFSDTLAADLARAELMLPKYYRMRSI